MRKKCNTCLACSKTYKWRKSLHRHVRESPECWPVLLVSGNSDKFSVTKPHFPPIP
ncbi:hypothetical protein PUN28_000299 [Cardiocondyla obscurior]|uniref:C2H2-type domain-containing protein n=1 Tax=Cardiocondyla obscurior TaxID=286306 RepID=A0AAW2GYT7_9HYME